MQITIGCSYMLTTLLLLFGVSLGINLFMYLIAYTFQTDKLTDISYSITFIVLATWSFLLSDKSLAAILVLILIYLWAVRLGTYLMVRIKHMGQDERFNDIRTNKLSFLGFWFVQGISVFIISLSFLLHMIEGYSIDKRLLIVGTTISILGWGIEALADYQKFKFKKSHPDQFMSTGLWSRIRHPNYLGEILFWIGIPILQWGNDFSINMIALIGPLWICFLLLKFSGIPILEKSWEKKYGEHPSFTEYKTKSYRLIPGIY
ncbi:MAG: DUF1295 domain-containing protein [Saprospiraceae bacterium]|nr:DUF1295 domain-containing protein [Saprospiraceae bacterium]